MDAFDTLFKQIDEKVAQLSEHVSGGSVNSHEEYKKLCGEIRGLLLARGYVSDLKQRLEYSDE